MKIATKQQLCWALVVLLGIGGLGAAQAQDSKGVAVTTFSGLFSPLDASGEQAA